MKNTIPTAEEFLKQEASKHQFSYTHSLIKFTKLHVERFREELLENVETTFDSANNVVVDKNSILNAYPLTLIK